MARNTWANRRNRGARLARDGCRMRARCDATAQCRSERGRDRSTGESSGCIASGRARRDAASADSTRIARGDRHESGSGNGSAHGRHCARYSDELVDTSTRHQGAVGIGRSRARAQDSRALTSRLAQQRKAQHRTQNPHENGSSEVTRRGKVILIRGTMIAAGPDPS